MKNVTKESENDSTGIEFLEQIPKPLLWGMFIVFCLFIGYMIGKDIAM